MALKTKYSKKEDIPKGAEEHYVEKDGEFHLESDFEDVGALKRAKDHEAKARKAAEDKVASLSTELDTVKVELEDIRKGAIPKADVDALEKSYKTKLEKREAELTSEIATLRSSVDKHVLQTEVDKLAGELFDKNAIIGRPHIASRLTLETVNGEHVVRVLDKDGKPSAGTLDDLKKEMLQTPAFASILVATRASGGGANGGQGGGGAPSDKSFDAATASARDLVAHLDSKGK